MIGDVLTSSILFEALRKKYPEAKLHYLIQRHTVAVVENNPYIDEVVFDLEDEAGDTVSFFEFSKRIKSEKYDVVIDAYSKIGSAALTFASGAKMRIGYRKSYTRLAYNHTFNYDRQPRTDAGLAIENRLKLLTPLLDQVLKPVKPKIYLTDEEIASAKKLLAKHNLFDEENLIMISALGSSEAKTYPLAYMAEVLDRIAQKTDALMFVNYIPQQRPLIDTLLQSCQPETLKQIKPEVYAKGLREFLALLSQCTAIIGNEGGAINMAKALDLPTYSIYSPATRREAWDSFGSDKQVSVHYFDHDPGMFVGGSGKQVKKLAPEMYSRFIPELLFETLEAFLKKVV